VLRDETVSILENAIEQCDGSSHVCSSCYRNLRCVARNSSNALAGAMASALANAAIVDPLRKTDEL
jgi:hypothetical protein